MNVELGAEDVLTAMQTAVAICSDERMATPNDLIEGAYCLKLVAQQVLQGNLVIEPANQKPPTPDGDIVVPGA